MDKDAGHLIFQDAFSSSLGGFDSDNWSFLFILILRVIQFNLFIGPQGFVSNIFG